MKTKKILLFPLIVLFLLSGLFFLPKTAEAACSFCDYGDPVLWPGRLNYLGDHNCCVTTSGDWYYCNSGGTSLQNCGNCNPDPSVCSQCPWSVDPNIKNPDGSPIVKPNVAMSWPGADTPIGNSCPTHLSGTFGFTGACSNMSPKGHYDITFTLTAPRSDGGPNTTTLCTGIEVDSQGNFQASGCTCPTNLCSGTNVATITLSYSNMKFTWWGKDGSCRGFTLDSGSITQSNITVDGNDCGPGVCDGANGHTFGVTETAYYNPYIQCTKGNSNNTDFPTKGNSVTWQCCTTAGGCNTGSCTADRSRNGACGSADQVDVTSAPTANLCSYSSTTPSVTDTHNVVNGPTGPWTWTCTAYGGGVNDICSALVLSCGSAKGVGTNSKPTANLCSYYDTLTDAGVMGGPPWVWWCKNSDASATVVCCAPGNGACNPAKEVATTSAPTGNLCSYSSTTPSVSGTGPWTWTCTGTTSCAYGSGSNDSCTAPLLAAPEDGVCPSPPTHYNCSSGDLSIIGEFLDRYEWWCNGKNGSTVNVRCKEWKVPQCGGAQGSYTTSETWPHGDGRCCEPGDSTPAPCPNPTEGHDSNWTCTTDGGTGIYIVPCKASRAAAAGTCGGANGHAFAYTDTSYSPYLQCPTGQTIINQSSPAFPDPGGSATWQCHTTGGDSGTCTATRAAAPVYGACSSPPTHYNCSSGDLGGYAQYADRWEWWCNGNISPANTAGTGNVLCKEPIVTATCGLANSSTPPGAKFAYGDWPSGGWNAWCDPASTLRAGDSTSDPGPGGSITWHCDGSGGGGGATCYAYEIGACNSAATGNYTWNEAFPNGNPCSSGTPNPNPPTALGYANGAISQWTCSGSTTCTAIRACPDSGLRVWNGTKAVVIEGAPISTQDSPLKITGKNGVVYGIGLVSVGATNDSGVRIQTSSGTKALAQCP